MNKKGKTKRKGRFACVKERESDWNKAITTFQRTTAWTRKKRRRILKKTKTPNMMTKHRA